MFEKIELERVSYFLHIAMKARKIQYGMDSCKRSIQRKEAKVILFTQDFSEKAKDKFANLCKEHKIPYYECGTKTGMSEYFNKETGVIAITDENIAKGIFKLI